VYSLDIPISSYGPDDISAPNQIWTAAFDALPWIHLSWDYWRLHSISNLFTSGNTCAWTQGGFSITLSIVLLTSTTIFASQAYTHVFLIEESISLIRSQVSTPGGSVPGTQRLLQTSQLTRRGPFGTLCQA
jgi:hypothetical protein